MGAEPTDEDPLAGLPVFGPETLGRHSVLEQLALRLRALGKHPRELQEVLGLSDTELLALHYDFEKSLRPVQRFPPVAWETDLTLGGRGAGKTHKGAGAVLREAQADPEARILIVGPTYTEIIKNQLEGPSGLMTLSPPWFKITQKHHKRSKKQIICPNGVVIDYLPAQKADKFRGYGYTLEWLDEVAAWDKDPVDVIKECWRVGRGTTARMRRLGLSPRKVITTTPKPTPVFKHLVEEQREGLVVTQTSTFDNAQHLDASYIRMAKRLAGTTEGEQEFLGKLRFNLDPAIYRKVNWNRSRIKSLEHMPPRPETPGDWMPAKYARRHGTKISTLFDFIVISNDPGTGEKKTADEHGIVVEGFRWEPDGLLHTYVLADLSFKSPEPSAWAKVSVKAHHAWKGYAPPKRTWVFAESNTGGNMVRGAIKAVDGSVPVRTRRAGHGTGGKAQRATPSSMLAEADLVHMVGRHQRLEDQLSRFTGQEGGHARDDRADAFAWPIFLYVAPRREMRGAAGVDGSMEEAEEDESEE